MRTLRVLFLSFLLVAAAPARFTPYLVKDIAPTTRSGNSYPTNFVRMGELELFQIWRFDHTELWRSDGTASGTYRLVDFFGIGSSSHFVIAGNRCFFEVQRERWELWITDGTLPGTHYVSDISDNYGEPGSEIWLPRQGVLYFGSGGPDREEHGIELWRSDGTPGGTYEVLDVEPGPDSSLPSHMTSFRGQLYFLARSRLWRSDGTAAGTFKVSDTPAKGLQVFGSHLVFVGTDSRGDELWVSDGTAAGTRRITDLAPGEASTSFLNLQAIGKRLFFTAGTATRGRQLYVTDGTAAGTRRLTRFSDPYALGFDPPAPLGDRLLFWATDLLHGYELWISDGTPQGTHEIPGACPSAYSCNGNPLLLHKGRYYYGVYGSEGSQLWVTDGTTPGSRKVSDIPDGGRNWPARLGTSGDRLLFVTTEWDASSTGIWATDGTAEGTVEVVRFGEESRGIEGGTAGDVVVFSGVDREHGVELWRSDGTTQGTQFLADIVDEDVGGSHPHDPMSLGDTLLFFAGDGHGFALWRSDGTTAGTVSVKRGLYGQIGWTGSSSRVFFTVQARHGLTELWTSDGSETGTLRVTPDSALAIGELSRPATALGSRVFFSATDRNHGAEPWITDGTPGGTRRVADLVPGPESSSPRGFTIFAGKAWFAAASRLWKSDGTLKGTVALGPELQEIQIWTAYADRLWFSGIDGEGRTELWSTGGTAASTRFFAELPAIASPTVHAGRLWLLAGGSQLWSTDGTPPGTRSFEISVDQPLQALISDGARLYLSSSSSGLWVSDGTAGGTRKISTHGVGHPAQWMAVPERLFYQDYYGSLYTSDGTEPGTGPVRPDRQPLDSVLFRRTGGVFALTYGGELWMSDGTVAGTRLIRDLSPSYYYEPANVMKAGSRLFFPAWEKETGVELWALRE